MNLLDVNVLVGAHRADAPHHEPAASVMRYALSGAEPFCVPEVVLCGFVRIVTNARVFPISTPLVAALAVAGQIREHENAVGVAAGPRHWQIFSQLCVDAGASGNLVTDAHLAALAIEHGCEVVSFDRDFARFPGLRWRSPLD